MNRNTTHTDAVIWQRLLALIALSAVFAVAYMATGCSSDDPRQEPGQEQKVNRIEPRVEPRQDTTEDLEVPQTVQQQDERFPQPEQQPQQSKTTQDSVGTELPRQNKATYDCVADQLVDIQDASVPHFTRVGISDKTFPTLVLCAQITLPASYNKSEILFNATLAIPGHATSQSTQCDTNSLQRISCSLTWRLHAEVSDPDSVFTTGDTYRVALSLGAPATASHVLGTPDWLPRQPNVSITPLTITVPSAPTRQGNAKRNPAQNVTHPDNAEQRTTITNTAEQRTTTTPTTSDPQSQIETPTTTQRSNRTEQEPTIITPTEQRTTTSPTTSAPQSQTNTPTTNHRSDQSQNTEATDPRTPSDTSALPQKPETQESTNLPHPIVMLDTPTVFPPEVGIGEELFVTWPFSNNSDSEATLTIELGITCPNHTIQDPLGPRTTTIPPQQNQYFTASLYIHDEMVQEECQLNYVARSDNGNLIDGSQGATDHPASPTIPVTIYQPTHALYICGAELTAIDHDDLPEHLAAVKSIGDHNFALTFGVCGWASDPTTSTFTEYIGSQRLRYSYGWGHAGSQINYVDATSSLPYFLVWLFDEDDFDACNTNRDTSQVHIRMTALYPSGEVPLIERIEDVHSVFGNQEELCNLFNLLAGWLDDTGEFLGTTASLLWSCITTQAAKGNGSLGEALVNSGELLAKVGYGSFSFITDTGFEFITNTIGIIQIKVSEEHKETFRAHSRIAFGLLDESDECRRAGSNLTQVAFIIVPKAAIVEGAVFLTDIIESGSDFIVAASDDLLFPKAQAASFPKGKVTKLGGVIINTGTVLRGTRTFVADVSKASDEIATTFSVTRPLHFKSTLANLGSKSYGARTVIEYVDDYSRRIGTTIKTPVGIKSAKLKVQREISLWKYNLRRFADEPRVRPSIRAALDKCPDLSKRLKGPDGVAGQTVSEIRDLKFRYRVGEWGTKLRLFECMGMRNIQLVFAERKPWLELSEELRKKTKADAKALLETTNSYGGNRLSIEILYHSDNTGQFELIGGKFLTVQ